MLTHASPQFTPAQLIDAGRRAEAEGRPDLAIQFYRHLTEHFAEAAQAAEAYGALGRLGPWQSAVPQAATHRASYRRLPPGRDRYVAGRAMARFFGLLGWLLALAGLGAVPAYLYLRVEDADWSRADVWPMAGGAAGGLVLGFGVVLAAHMARALFDQANATRDLVAIERARQENE